MQSYHIPGIPFAAHHVSRRSWCSAICHCFTPSVLRWIEAIKCSQTSGGISSTGCTLNNSTPCLSYSGRAICAHTHTDTRQRSKTSSVFPPIMSRPRGRGCSVGLVPERWVAKYLGSEEVERLLTSRGDFSEIRMLVVNSQWGFLMATRKRMGNVCYLHGRKKHSSWIIVIRWSDLTEKEQVKSPKKVFNTMVFSQFHGLQPGYKTSLLSLSLQMWYLLAR